MALDVALDVLEERVRDLARHQRGLSYAVESVSVDTGDARELAVLVDARDGQEAAVARLLWDAYRGLADRGPTWAEVAHAVGGRLESGEGSDARRRRAGRAALDELADRPGRTSAELLAAWQEVTPQAATAALRATLPTAILAVPSGVELPALCGGIDRRPLCDVGAGAAAPEPVRRPAARPAAGPQPAAARRRRSASSPRPATTAPCTCCRGPTSRPSSPAADGRGMLVVGRNLCTLDVHEDRYGRRAVAAVSCPTAAGALAGAGAGAGVELRVPASDVASVVPAPAAAPAAEQVPASV